MYGTHVSNTYVPHEEFQILFRIENVELFTGGNKNFKK
jgi:hypothetical protein